MEYLKLLGQDETRALIAHYQERIKFDADRNLERVESHIARLRELWATLPRDIGF